MSMVHTPTILPPPRDRVAELTRENESLKAEIRELRNQLAREQERSGAVEEGAFRLRGALSPLYIALQQVFGDLDAMGIEEGAGKQSAPATAKSAVWESWKQKLGGKVAQAIDVLALHGEMNAKQLRLHLQCGNDYIYNVISKLHTNGLINKNGGKISLKQL